MTVTTERTYQGMTVPEAIAAAWNTWEAAEWRKQRWIAANNSFNVPDQRFSVSAPGGMCARHLEMRRRFRDMYFDDRKGYRWPGTPCLEWSVIPDRDMLTRRRVEWDEKASEQMQLIERLCLSGDSVQCDGHSRTCKGCRHLVCTCEES
jgi:hypothetical protein